MNALKHAAFRTFSAPVVGAPLAAWLLGRKLEGRRIPLHKVKNLVLAQREMLAGKVKVESLPYILNLDLLNKCNLRCPFCATGTNQMDRAKGRLPLERAKAVIDAVKDHVISIRFYDWGEPFMNPEIHDVVRYAHDAGLRTVIASNLSVKIAPERIVESGLDVLKVSMDGLEQQSLSAYRKGSNLELVQGNVKKIVEARRQLGRKNPKVQIDFLVFKQNEHELPLLEARRRELGADVIEANSAFIYDENYVPRTPKYQPRQNLFTHNCDFLYSELYVEADGRLSPCCSVTSNRWDVGGIEDLQDVRSFWNSPAYQSMRAYWARRPDYKDLNGGKAILCEHCDLVQRDGRKPTRLSPLPPSYVADGKTYPVPGEAPAVPVFRSA